MALPFDPRSISSLILWLDGSDPSSLITNGDSVIQWRDKSINRNHTAFSSTTAPTLSSINGISSVYFNSRSGNSQYFQGPLSTILQSSFTGYISSFFMFTVATMTSTSVTGINRSFIQIGYKSSIVGGLLLYQPKNIQSTIGQYDAPASVGSGFYNSYISTNLVAYNRPFQLMTTSFNKFIPVPVNNNAAPLMTLSLNGEYPRINLNNTTTQNYGAIQYSIGGNLIGAANAATCWDGHIAEVLLYSPRISSLSTMTMEQVQQIQGYLATKWGIQDDLVSYHPYKARPVALSSLTSALLTDTTSNSKLFILPSSQSISTQMLWIQGNNNYLSTTTFANEGTVNYSNSFTQLNYKNKNALLVNNGNLNWTLHSMFEGDLKNVGYAPYTYFTSFSTIGSNSLGYAASIATNSNGLYLVVGASNITVGTSTNSGTVFMYKKNILSDNWQQSQLLQTITPSDITARDKFGTSVCMSYDANYLLIGSAGNKAGTAITDVGAAYIFKKSATSDLWNQVQKLLVSDAQQNMLTANTFQSAMSQDGSIVALASKSFATLTPTPITNAGIVYMFTKNPTTDLWSQVQSITLSYPTTTARFGTCVSMSADGSYLVVGASNYAFNTAQANLGSAFVYKKNPSSDIWDYLQGLQRDDTSRTLAMGASVSISGNSQYIVTTCYNYGAYIFKKRTTTDYYDRIQFFLPQNIQSANNFGYTSAINYDGSFLALSLNSGTTTGGPMYLYKKQTFTDQWTQYSDSNFFSTPGSCAYGTSIAMDSNGSNFFVGGLGTIGRVFPYTQSSIGVVQPTFSFLNVDTSKQSRTILLPPASSNPGEFFWIKDTTNSASNYPVSISTPSGTYLMSNYNGMFFYANNFCAQFQSDGISNYNLVNYYTGSYTQLSNSTNFIPFAAQQNGVGNAGRASTLVLQLNINIVDPPTTQVILTQFSKNISLPRPLSYDNIYFKSYDNQTLLPFWQEPYYASNVFYVRLPYVNSNYYTPYYLYWDTNYKATQNGFSTFDFFDDFSSSSNGQPDPLKWRVDLKGSGTPIVSQNTDLFMTLQGVDNQNSSANIVTRFPIFGGTKGYLLSNTFQIRANLFFTSTTGICMSLGVNSTIQDLAGAQTNWSITTLGEGVTYYSSTATRHFTFRTNPGVAATRNSSNIVTSFGTATTWQMLIGDQGNIRQTMWSNTALLTGFTPLNTVNDLYLHIGQTSKIDAPTGKLFISYIAGFLTGETAAAPVNIIWGNTNKLEYFSFTFYT